MARSVPPRDNPFPWISQAVSRLPALTVQGRNLAMGKSAQLRDVRLPEALALALAAPDDGRLSADYVRVLGELWDLERLLAESTTLGEKTNQGVVELGDLVTIEFAPHGLRRRRTVEQYLLVHPAEAPLDQWRISIESPLARAVLGHRVGAQVEVDAPAGRYAVRIIGTGAPPEGT
jgi:transcription elongation GreA/GreB family factor